MQNPQVSQGEGQGGRGGPLEDFFLQTVFAPIKDSEKLVTMLQVARWELSVEEVARITSLTPTQVCPFTSPLFLVVLVHYLSLFQYFSLF